MKNILKIAVAVIAFIGFTTAAMSADNASAKKGNEGMTWKFQRGPGFFDGSMVGNGLPTIAMKMSNPGPGRLVGNCTIAYKGKETKFSVMGIGDNVSIVSADKNITLLKLGKEAAKIQFDNKESYSPSGLEGAIEIKDNIKGTTGTLTIYVKDPRTVATSFTIYELGTPKELMIASLMMAQYIYDVRSGNMSPQDSSTELLK